MSEHWQRCLAHLEGEMDEVDFQTWLRPLQARMDGRKLRVFAPNEFVLDAVAERFWGRIRNLLHSLGHGDDEVSLEVGSAAPPSAVSGSKVSAGADSKAPSTWLDSALDSRYTFENFVEGKSNELGKATALQVASALGGAYNPLLLYGGTGLGKTHLLHATGNRIRAEKPGAKVVYLRSEQFVSGMINALRQSKMDSFKSVFRRVDALLIDDIQFLAGKDRSQEEFFHTFNALFDAKQQIILTCDRYPKEVENLQPRLKSRFGWGLSVAIEPPDYETRVAILLSKAQGMQFELPEPVAFLIAKRMRSNVRDLEGALNTLYARANFTGQAITSEFAQETLRSLLTVHDQLITLSNIQKKVADYYQLRLTDMLSRRRTRSIARPRQMAMALAKELTDHSLPEIGEGFGGRDHTTVMHACKTIRSLTETDGRMRDDWDKLMRAINGEGI